MLFQYFAWEDHRQKCTLFSYEVRINLSKKVATPWSLKKDLTSVSGQLSDTFRLTATCNSTSIRCTDFWFHISIAHSLETNIQLCDVVRFSVT